MVTPKTVFMVIVGEY